MYLREDIMADRLILYYSLTDNTREAAEKAAEALGADLLRIDL